MRITRGRGVDVILYPSEDEASLHVAAYWLRSGGWLFSGCRPRPPASGEASGGRSTPGQRFIQMRQNIGKVVLTA
jgi:hypothetical protein